MNEEQPKRTMNTETNKMHWVHWLYIVPFSFALSPIGTFIGVIGWKLNFVSTCILISVQFVGFLFLYAISNGGE